jgi:hypothetical protein
MPVFYRIINDVLYAANVKKLGIPKEQFTCPYPSNFDGNIYLTRGCFSIGDWGIISGLPFALKQIYPNCKVYLPKPNWLKNIIYSTFALGKASHWENAWENSDIVFKNNPYVDGYFDLGETQGDITIDHYRVYTDNEEEPLVEQMLRFFGATEEQIQSIDSRPQLFFDEDEIKLGNSIIESYIDEKEYGTLLLTNSVKEYYDDDINSLLLEEINKYKNLTFFYYGSKPLKDTIFKNIKSIDLKSLDLPIRIQLYIKAMAQVNIGYQSGINDTISTYSQVICTPSTDTLGTNIVRGIKYLYKNKTLCI